jgi:hypothetical protein
VDSQRNGETLDVFLWKGMEVKKYYELQISNAETFPDQEALDKMREMKFPGNFWGWFAGKLVVRMYRFIIKMAMKEWDRKVLQEPDKLEEIPKFPVFNLMKVYEEPNHIMREIK